MVSACLIGRRCRYDGGDNLVPAIASLHRRGLCLPVCPETEGGLPTPRIPCERCGKTVLGKDGSDRTALFYAGAARCLALARACGAKRAILKARSPCCGAGSIYDGSFSRVLISGDGVFAQLLRADGFALATEENCAALLQEAGIDVEND